ncbi:SDR family oxidoreductase [Rothia sp. ARF10]|nr:SDR family oxidoreductase [Rothia sp. ARF10]
MSTDLFRLDGAVALVSGATGWLGVPMVRALAEAGADVVAVGRRQEALDDLAAAQEADGFPVTVAACDVTSPDWPSLIESVGKDRGRVDVLVNNAHVGRGGSLGTATEENFDEGYELAVKSAWRAMRAATSSMRLAVAAGGSPSIVNIASMYGMVGPDLSLYDTEAGRTPPYYGAAKAALLQLTRYAAAELGPEGIRVNAISPGPFPAEAARANEEFLGRLASRTMLDRVGDRDELRTALLFLASPHSGFVTGSNVVVDGGWTAR